MSPAVLVGEVVEVVSWQARAEAAEARVAELSEQVAVLSRMLFGRSSEKTRPPSDPGVTGDGDGGVSGCGGSKRARGQQPGGRGHGRRDYSHLDTREVIHDVPIEQRCCVGCGIEFERLGVESSEQVDWHVQVTRVVHRRLRYRRRCDCRGCGR